MHSNDLTIEQIQADVSSLYQQIMNKAQGKRWQRARNELRKLKPLLSRVPHDELVSFIRYNPDVISFSWRCLIEQRMSFPYLELLASSSRSYDGFCKLFEAFRFFDYAKHPVSVYRTFLIRNYDVTQQVELLKGIKQGVLPSTECWELYANPQLNAAQMQAIRKGIVGGHLTVAQVRVYAKPEFNWEQMDELRKGIQRLPKEVWMSYSNPSFSSSQMRAIRLEFERNALGVEALPYVKHQFNDRQLEIILRGLKSRRLRDYVVFYAKPEFSVQQMVLIANAVKKGLSKRQIEALAKPGYSIRAMNNIFETFVRMNNETSIQQEGRIADQADDYGSKCNKNQVGKEKLILKAYFSERLVTSIKRQNENIWNAWLQSKQIFVFEDAFAKQILSHSDAAEEVQGEALIRCPFTTSYIIGKEEDGTKLEFFAVLDGNVLRFQQMQNEEAILDCELKVDQLRTGKQMLDAIESPLSRSTAMKMLQLYSCLCSATLEEAPDTVAKSDPALAPSTATAHDRSLEKDVPSWNLDVYTVTMRHDIKKQRRRAKSNDSADSPVRKPHPRRAHWHHYWVGSRKDEASRRLVLKWLPEIVVNQKEDMPVRIILVKNNQ